MNLDKIKNPVKQNGDKLTIEDLEIEFDAWDNLSDETFVRIDTTLPLELK